LRLKYYSLEKARPLSKKIKRKGAEAQRVVLGFQTYHDLYFLIFKWSLCVSASLRLKYYSLENARPLSKKIKHRGAEAQRVVLGFQAYPNISFSDF
jgi:hypothetical protein